MRVGIITIFAVPNYGAALQSYALSHYLRDQGIEAETVDYRQPELEAYFRPRLGFPPPIRHWLRLNSFRKFVAKDLQLGPVRIRSVQHFKTELARYDAFITGSDQVWFTGPVQFFDPMFFLDFPAPGRRKISYAASVGGSESFGVFTPQVQRALQNIGHLGVRDPHTAGLVAPLVSRSPVPTVDPVFLHDFPQLRSPKSPSAEPYLLVFGDFRHGLSRTVDEVKAATGLRKVVTLQYPCSSATTRIASPGPAEWLNWFVHANFVLTSYFHGTAIAVKFARPFVAVPTPGRRVKVATLLRAVGLENRCLNDAAAIAQAGELAAQPIDWKMVRDRLAPQIESSKAFLRQALA